jgi:hypothetical protein
MIFRIDDVSINTNQDKLLEMIRLLDEKFVHSRFLLGISPLVCNMQEHTDKRNERIFPSIFNAYSDHRIFYRVEKCGIPDIVATLIKTYGNKIDLAGHGLIHVDHRLLTKEVQELSIVTSCNLIGAKTYIPPFNKWNADTVEICKEFNIHLIKFESGWKHLGYEAITNNYSSYYFHTHDFTLDEFKAILERSKVA